MRVLICGGGVIGASIAYFLSCRRVEATVIERTGLACAASGKSGGFLALDWCDGTPLAPLARRSFALHARLAEEMSGDWGYRRLTTHGGSAGHQKGFRHRDNDHGIGWPSAAVRVHQRLGSTKTTAQVHPGRFTQAIMRAAQARGAELRIGRVTGVVQQGNTGRVEGVLVDGEKIDGDAVVIAMGPWSILATEWLPLPAVFGLKGHSLVFDTDVRLSADALLANTGATGAVEGLRLALLRRERRWLLPTFYQRRKRRRRAGATPVKNPDSCYCTRFRRTQPSPARAIPSSASEAGSGVFSTAA